MAKVKKGGKGIKMEKYQTLRSPKGIAGFSYLTEPDTKYGAKHRIQIFVDSKDPEVKAFAATLRATEAKYLKTINKAAKDGIPGLKKADAYLAEKFGKFGVKEGSLYFEFSTNAREMEDGEGWLPVQHFDSKGVPTTKLQVWGGDIVRAQVTLMGYNTGTQFGIKAYLDAVQVIEKRSGGRINTFVDESDGTDLPAEGEEVTIEVQEEAAEVSEPAENTAINLDDLV